MKRLYIITGAKGHLARTIIKYLRREDCHIRGLILPRKNGKGDHQITYYKGDVADISSMDAIFSDISHKEVVVIHTAGIISIESKVTPRLYQVNVEGTKNVVSQCRRHNVHRLIYISSVHAIPEPSSNKLIKEVNSFPMDQVVGAYASTKAQASQLVMDASKEGLNAIILHPSGIIGPYDKGDNHIVQLIQMYISGKLPAGVAGGYDFVDVRDVAKGCIAAVDKGKLGETYILSNRYYTIKELLKYMRLVSGGKRKICVPLWLAKIMQPIFELMARVSNTRPLYTKYSLYTLRSNTRFSHDKATRELGYSPRDIKITIADTIEWLQNQ